MRLVNYYSNIASNKKILAHDVVSFLLKVLENADYQLCVDIENDLVKFGNKAIKYLVSGLESSNNQVRRHSAMALIRIGSECIEPLKNEYNNKPHYQWMVDFIITEINDIDDFLIDDNYCISIAS